MADKPNIPTGSDRPNDPPRTAHDSAEPVKPVEPTPQERQEKAELLKSSGGDPLTQESD